MKITTLKYLKDWKVSHKFKELYHKPISITGRLDSSLMTNDEIEDYNSFGDGDEWDDMYTIMVDIKEPEHNPRIYIGSSLKLLLESKGYKNYNGLIKVHGMFGTRPTTKTHIAEILKADILDKELNIIEILEK